MLKLDEMDPAFDAVVAAPGFHRILLENDQVRVLEVVIDPGAREPFHTHLWQSIFVVMGTPHLRYFVPASGPPLFEIQPQQETGVLHLAPEGLHALENIDNRGLYAFRVEMKRAPFVVEPEGARGPILQVGATGKDLRLENSVVRVCTGGHDRRFDRLSSVILLPGASRAAWRGLSRQSETPGEDDIVISFKYL